MSKKLMSTVIAVALAVGMCPAAALADEPGGALTFKRGAIEVQDADVQRDFSFEDASMEATPMLWSGKELSPQVEVAIDDEVLPPDAYDLAYYRYDADPDGEWPGEPVQVIKEPGVYVIEATGVAPYEGTAFALCEVFKPQSISDGFLSCVAGGFRYTGEPLRARLAWWFEGGLFEDSPVPLVEGENCTIEYYEDETDYDDPDADYVLGNKLTGAPVEVGSYVAVVSLNGYPGTLSETYEIWDARNLVSASIRYKSTLSLADTGGSLNPIESVCMGDTVLEEGTDYIVRYYPWIPDEEEENALWVGDELEGAPSEPGSYAVYIEGTGSADGEGWFGENTISYEIRETGESDYSEIAPVEPLENDGRVDQGDKGLPPVTTDPVTTDPETPGPGTSDPKETAEPAKTSDPAEVAPAPVTPAEPQKTQNTLSIRAKAAKVTVKASALKKKAKTLTNVVVSGGQGKVTFKNVSANKSAKKFKVDSKGRVKLTKGLKPGSYKVKLRAKAAGDASHLPSTSKNVSFTVKVKAEKTAKEAKAEAAKYTINTSRYKVIIPKPWRGKVVWKTETYRYISSQHEWKTAPVTEIYLKGHKGDDEYRVAMVSGSLADQPGPGLDISSLSAAAVSNKGNPNDTRFPRAYVTCPNMVYRAYYWEQNPKGRKISDAGLAKMLKITTNGKVSLEQARSYGNYVPNGKNTYFNVPQKYLTKIFKGMLTCK